MAEVAMTFSVLPENSEDDVDVLSQGIRQALDGKCRVVSITKKELAFGLKSLQLVVILERAVERARTFPLPSDS